MREIILGIMCIIFIICYFKVGNSIQDEKLHSVLLIGVMIFIFGISMLPNFTLINQNDELMDKVKNKCPEYEKIDNVYKLK